MKKIYKIIVLNILKTDCVVRLAMNTNKKKYETKFNDNWLMKADYKSWLGKVDQKTALCRDCNIRFVVKWEGEKAITKHLNSEGHKTIVSEI